ncbi:MULTISPECIES: hypothetical protein [Pirellulaceae]|nr:MULTISPECIES: hypothetical protein [Pirellulaceae]
MQQRAIYPKRPVRATFITFLSLSAFVGAFMPFDQTIRDAWPFALGYCALLAVSSVGLARLGWRGWLLVVAGTMIAVAPAAVGIALMLRPGGSIEDGDVWLPVSLYLFYALMAFGVCLVIRGWTLYFTKSDETD